MEEDAVEDQAEAASENQRSTVSGYRGRNSDRKREAAITSSKKMNDAAKQKVEQATSNLGVAGVALAGRTSRSDLNLGDSLATVGTLHRPDSNRLAAKRAASHDVRPEALDGRRHSGDQMPFPKSVGSKRGGVKGGVPEQPTGSKQAFYTLACPKSGKR